MDRCLRAIWRTFIERYGLRREPADEPAIGFAGVLDAVVQAVGTPLPEFQSRGDHAVAAPVTWARDIAVGIALAELADALLECLSIGQDLGLRGGGGADPRFQGARVEVRLRLRLSGADDGSLNANLALQLGPEADERSARVGIELTGLAAVVVGEEGEAVLIHRFEQDHPS